MRYSKKLLLVFGLILSVPAYGEDRLGDGTLPAPQNSDRIGDGTLPAPENEDKILGDGTLPFMGETGLESEVLRGALQFKLNSEIKDVCESAREQIILLQPNYEVLEVVCLSQGTEGNLIRIEARGSQGVLIIDAVRVDENGLQGFAFWQENPTRIFKILLDSMN